MTSATNRSFSDIFVSLAYAGAPLALALVLGYSVASLTVGDLGTEEAILVSDRLMSVFFWSFLLGGAGGVGALYYRLRTGGAGIDMGTLLTHLAVGRVQEALAEARERGILTAELEQSIEKMRSQGNTLRSTSATHQQSLEQMGGAVTSLTESLTQGLDLIQDVDHTAGQSLQFFRGINDNIEGLSRSAEETSSSILEMAAINNEVAENIHALSGSVEETTTAIEEMTFSVKEVARNIEELSTAAEETAASMNQMDVSISQVDTNASETARLSETVTTDAELGVTAINRTIEGIDRIKHTSRTAADVIGSLGERISAIGNILTVIDDVAEQTNLLALNAAIIAAQAGEHGRGFAVVADEIKALAERTGASTKEIADLIKTVQSESKRAIDVMSRGVDDVEEGVRLGHDAEDALRKIVESAKRSTLMIKAIAQATVEQAKGSKQVTNAISRIAETVQQIALATAEQAKGSEQIMRSAERMKTITQQVERSTEEQNRGGRQITEAVENIRETVENISQSQREQLRGTKEIVDAVQSIKDFGERSSAAGRDLERLLGESASQLDGLRVAIEQF